jgi:tRNA (cytidine/uridine-2'-O-)-methyltransferase
VPVPLAHVVLVAPEIAGNTGNVIRLCANTGAHLHLVEPLGFVLEDRLLRRAGLDYHDLASMSVHTSFDVAMEAIGSSTFVAFTSKATQRFDEVPLGLSDVLVFGCERNGLGRPVLDDPRCVARALLPMRPGNRSLNLANSVAVVVYDRWRQLGYEGAAMPLMPVDGQGLTAETFVLDPFDS